MPFVLMPNLWNTLSSFSNKMSSKQERVHGDGILVDYDSPEALEEVFWRIFTGDDYNKNEILIPMDADDEVITKFRSYIATILTKSSSAHDKLYLSSIYYQIFNVNNLQ